MADIVLIHGAMHGAWCWERIVPLLECQGHTVTARDLPALGADRTPAAAVTLESWGRFAVDILQNRPGKVVLAGHSMGGMVISQAAEYAPDCISALVYVSALLPTNGDSAFGLAGRGDVSGQEPSIKMHVSPDGEYLIAGSDKARSFFYHETPAEWADRAMSLIVPQPLAVMQAPAMLSTGRFGAVPRVYIECLRDRVLPLALQRSMQAAAPCEAVFEIDTDHSPFYSRPEMLAADLNEIARRYG